MSMLLGIRINRHIECESILYLIVYLLNVVVLVISYRLHSYQYLVEKQT